MYETDTQQLMEITEYMLIEKRTICTNLSRHQKELWLWIRPFRCRTAKFLAVVASALHEKALSTLYGVTL